MTKARDLSQTPNASLGFKNRIINGDCRIDQRNNGASVNNSAGNIYTLDRWNIYGDQASKFSIQQNAGSVTPPNGFRNYLGITSSSAYSVTSSDIFIVRQHIEGFNTADLMWGTANAATVTLSFWVRSSLTGTFGGALNNSNQSRNYPFSYTISSANTWEQKTITVAGDTTGTWLTTNGTGISLSFGLGVGTTYSGTAGSWSGSTFFSATGATSVVGTNGATWYITGVQLEKGSTATSFDYRPYGTELALCRRYFTKYYQNTNGVIGDTAVFTLAQWSGTNAYSSHWYQVSMRAAPSFSYSSNSDFALFSNGAVRAPSDIIQQGSSTDRCEMLVTVASAVNGGDCSWLRISGANGFVSWNAEL